jgi:outer membrane protein assembly complex protein YaeT
VYVPHVAYELRASVLRAHGNAGYPDCAVAIDTSVDPASGAVDLALGVEPGPRVRIDKITFRGDTEIPGRRLRSRIELEPGDRYSAQKVERSFQNLYATGLFDSVRFDLEGQGKRRTLVVETLEAPSLELYVEPGYGSYEGLRVRAGVDENNLFGSGRRGGFEGWLSALAKGLELQLADPFLFRTPVTGQATFTASNREEPSFTVDELGTELALKRHWIKELSTTLAIEYSETEVSDVSLVSSIPPQFVQDADIGELTFALAYDTRDNVLMPREGGLARFYTGIALDALGSSIEIFEYGLDLSTVLQVGDHTLVAARAGGAIVAPYGDTTAVPIQRRLFNGGENTVRSFREDELGPKDPNGEPVGGEARTIVSLEARRMIRGNVSGALFYDLGNVELDYRDYFEFDGMRHGIGVGLRYLLPIGPLRLDAAWNPDNQSNEDEWVVHFAVGLP